MGGPAVTERDRIISSMTASERAIYLNMGGRVTGPMNVPAWYQPKRLGFSRGEKWRAKVKAKHGTQSGRDHQGEDAAD